jgi:hypothetical protein
VVFNAGVDPDINVAAVGVLRGEITPGPQIVLTNEIDGAQGRAAVTTDATGLPWVIYYSQPEEGPPDAVEAIRNFFIPRSLAELEALQQAAGESDG